MATIVTMGALIIGIVIGWIMKDRLSDRRQRYRTKDYGIKRDIWKN